MKHFCDRLSGQRPRTGRRADHQRPVAGLRAQARHYRRDAGVPPPPAGRLHRQQLPHGRHRGPDLLSGRRRGVRRGPADSADEALQPGRTRRNAVPDLRGRTCARPNWSWAISWRRSRRTRPPRGACSTSWPSTGSTICARFPGAITARTERFMREAIKAVPTGSTRDRVVLDGFEQPLAHRRAPSNVARRPHRRRFRRHLAAGAERHQLGPQLHDGLLPICPEMSARAGVARTTTAASRRSRCGAPEGSIVNAHAIRRRRRSSPGRPLHSVRDLRCPGRGPAGPRRRGQLGAERGHAHWPRRCGRALRVHLLQQRRHGRVERSKDGLDATAFPSNVANVPIEVMEQSVPVLVTRRELISGSSGDGKHRGGAGQRIALRFARQTTGHGLLHGGTDGIGSAWLSRRWRRSAGSAPCSTVAPIDPKQSTVLAARPGARLGDAGRRRLRDPDRAKRKRSDPDCMAVAEDSDA